MILKIRNDETDWHFFDKIKHVMYIQGGYSITLLFNERDLSFAGGDYDAKFISYDQIFEAYQQANPTTSNFKISLLVVDFDDGTSQIYIFNTTAYLLNDNGKTVERFYGGVLPVYCSD